MSFLRTTFGGAAIVARRRARRDIVLLSAWMMLVAFVAFLSIEGPHLLIDTVNRGAQQAVSRAGAGADIELRSPVGQPSASDTTPTVTPDSFLTVANAVHRHLPGALGEVYRDEIVTVLSPSTSAIDVDGTAPATTLQVQLGMLTGANEKALAVTSGSLPSAASPSSAAIDVDVSAGSGLKVGDTISVGSLNNQLASSSAAVITLGVVGVVAEKQSATSEWVDMPNLWSPHTTGAKGARTTAITVLTTSAGIATAAGQYSAAGTGLVRIQLDPAKFTAAREARVDNEIVGLTGNNSSLAGSSVQFAVTSPYDRALSGYPPQSRAALAQMSVMIAGLLGVAAVVLVLLSRLLVLRRSGEILLERSRGSSLVAVAARALVESVVATFIGGVVGVGVALAVNWKPIEPPQALAAVLVVAVLATPIQTVLLTRGALGGRRVPANRQDRAEIASRARGRRLAAEITIVVLGAAALYSLSTRGLLETTTTGIDPFLASAPLLFAVITTVIVLRVYRWPVLGVAALGRRSRGVLGLVGAVRAVRAIAVLPLLALTLALALVVSGGLLVATVDAGQVQASWERTGADVRVDAPITAAQESAALDTAGVTDGAAVRIDPNIQTKLGSSADFPTVISIDSHFPKFVGSLPPGTLGGSDPTLFTTLEADSAKATATSVLPVVIDETIAHEIVTKNIGMYYGNGLVDLHVIGVTDVEPRGYIQGPFIYVDLAALSRQLPKPVGANQLLLNGTGALAAANFVEAASTDIHTRATWLNDRRHLALVQGTQNTMLIATIALALLAMIGLIATVLAGARERGRALSLLRTLGMRPGLGWWLALAELAPVVVAALIGGVASGVAMVLLLEPSLGLDVLSGGEEIPQTTVSPILILGLIGATFALMVISVLVEVVAHRRDKLSEVLRVGDTV
jgi:putative ABC transport system permease protein